MIMLKNIILTFDIFCFVWPAANPRPHAFFQLFVVNRVFEKEIDGFRSWECRNRHHMDLLYILICSNPKKVHSKKTNVVFYDCLMF